MSKILELREKRALAWVTAKAFLDTKRGNDGLINAEDANLILTHTEDDSLLQ